MRVKGYATRAAGEPLSPFAFDRRTPGDRDVQLAIQFCGICHSDIHAARNEWNVTTYPRVPGHEIVGRVTAVGSRVTKFRQGDVVGVGCYVDSCRICKSCEQGLESYCLNGNTLTYNSLPPSAAQPTFGGYSTHLVVNEDFVLRVPETLDPKEAALCSAPGLQPGCRPACSARRGTRWP